MPAENIDAAFDNDSDISESRWRGPIIPTLCIGLVWFGVLTTVLWVLTLGYEFLHLLRLFYGAII